MVLRYPKNYVNINLSLKIVPNKHYFESYLNNVCLKSAEPNYSISEKYVACFFILVTYFFLKIKKIKRYIILRKQMGLRVILKHKLQNQTTTVIQWHEYWEICVMVQLLCVPWEFLISPSNGSYCVFKETNHVQYRINSTVQVLLIDYTSYK